MKRVKKKREKPFGQGEKCKEFSHYLLLYLFDQPQPAKEKTYTRAITNQIKTCGNFPPLAILFVRKRGKKQVHKETLSPSTFNNSSITDN